MVESPTKTVFPSEFHTTFVVEQSSRDKIVLRAALRTKADVLQWMEQYRVKTKTEWIVKVSSDEMKNYVLRRKYICHLSSLNKRDTSKRDMDCKVTLDIHIKLETRDTKKRDPFLKQMGSRCPLPAVIEIKGVHNHHLLCAEALRLNRPAASVKRRCIELLEDGLTKAQCKKLISDELVTGGKLVDIADNQQNPTTNSMGHIHRAWSEKTFGKDPITPIEKIKEKINNGDYVKKGGNVFCVEENGMWSVLVVTALMKRIQQVEMAQEVTFIDTTSHLDVTCCNFTALATATKAGAMPLGILLHSYQTKDNYKQAFQLFKENCPNAFGGHQSPDIVMTDDSAPERAALSEVWPVSKLLLCLYHVLGKEWKWLLKYCDKKTRKTLMELFYKIVYAETEEEFDLAVKHIFTTKAACEKFLTRLESYLKRKEEWALYLRAELSMRGNDTNNFAEVTMKIIKEIVLERLRALNPVALVEFIFGGLENYYKKRLMEHANSRHTASRLLHSKLLARVENIDVTQVVKLDNNLYEVPSAKVACKTYEVHTDTGFCSCKAGERGVYCKHMALLVKHFAVELPNAPALSSRERHALGKLASGDDCLPSTFYLGLKEVQVDQHAPFEANASYEECEPSSPPNSTQYQPQPVAVTEESETKTAEEVAAKTLQAKAAFDRLLQLASLEIKPELLDRLIASLQRPKTSGAATAAIVRSYRAMSSNMRVGSYMGVNPAGRARRRAGVSQGAKQVPVGRPTKAELLKRSEKVSKRPRNLRQAVRNNSANAKAH